MLDHVTLGVSNVGRSRAFYDATLSLIGIRRLYAEGETFAAYGVAPKAFFWIGQKTGPITGVHVAFAVDSRDLVDRFHAAGLAAGGRDNGGPGLRPHYHPNYYGAFILDLDGHNIEAVCHVPVSQAKSG
jgi:catechol 2,3-dioxygenase-like lactoylglutathione lyase family enzyme